MKRDSGGGLKHHLEWVDHGRATSSRAAIEISVIMDGVRDVNVAMAVLPLRDLGAVNFRKAENKTGDLSAAGIFIEAGYRSCLKEATELRNMIMSLND